MPALKLLKTLLNPTLDCGLLLATLLFIGGYLGSGYSAHAKTLANTTITDDKTLKFNNLGQKITLQKEGKYFKDSKTGQRFVVAPRILLKTAKNVKVATLKKVDPEIHKIQVMYQGEDFNYQLLHLNDTKSMTKALQQLSSRTEVFLAQPDLLQVGVLDDHMNGTILTQHPGHQHQSVAPINPERRAKRVNRRYHNYLSRLGVDRLRGASLGKGVRIAIIDDGFNLKVDPLKHLSPIFTFDADSQKLQLSDAKGADDHGSKVASIIFAHSQRAILNGLAPQAEAILLKNSLTWTSQTLLSFQLAKLNKADVINCSWQSPYLLEPILDAVNDIALHGREGKGAVVVFAAGNQGAEVLPNNSEASITSAVVVGALSRGFKPLANSNFGDSVDLYAYGLRVKVPTVEDEYTDLAGTSLAAAIISGVAALMIAKNPEITLKELGAQLKKLSGPGAASIAGP